MNDLTRLKLDVDPKITQSPPGRMAELLRTDEVALDFVGSFAEIENDGNGQTFADETDIQGHRQEPLKPELNVPVVPAHTQDGSEILPAQDIISDDRQLVESYREDTKQPVRMLDGEPIDRAILNQSGKRIEAPARMELDMGAELNLPTEKPTIFEKRGLAMVRPNDIPSKVTALANADAGTLKDKLTVLQADLVSIPAKSSDSKISSTAGNMPSIARPIVPASQLSSVWPPATVFEMPTSPVAMTGMAQMGPITALNAVSAVPVVDIEAGDQWIVRLSQDIGRLSAEKSTLNFQLKPNHLGKLHVEITTGAAGDIIRLETESENAKALILGSQGRLEQDIRLSGLKLARVDVTVQDQSGSQLGQQGNMAQDSESGLKRDRGVQAESHDFGMQRLSSENKSAAASSHRGARYA